MASQTRAILNQIKGKRSGISDGVSNSLQYQLDNSSVSVWEFSHRITNKPSDDPSSWDWTPAIQGAIDYLDQTGLDPSKSGGLIIIPGLSGGVYLVTDLVVHQDVCITAYGATISPFSILDSRTHIIKFLGMNKVFGLQISMDYSLTYDCSIWCMGRNIDFVGCAVWFSKNATTVGDPSWSTTPTDAMFGDSEVSFSNCQFNWCLRACTAYGLNTIVTFSGGTRVYANRGAIPSGHVNYSQWLTEPISCVVSWGSLIYITGAYLCTFERGSPAFTSMCIRVSADEYLNSYGRLYLSGSHVETNFLFYAPAPIGYNSEDTTTRALSVTNCHGHVSTSPNNDFFIQASSQMKQGIHIDESCSFYGSAGVVPTRTKAIYAPGAYVHASGSSFPFISGDFKDSCTILYPRGHSSLLLVNASGSNQSIGTNSTTLIMPNNGVIDLDNSARGLYYNSVTGLFTAAIDLSNVELTIDIRYEVPSTLNTVTLDLVVSGANVDSVVSVGAYSRVTLKARLITKGSNFLIRAVGLDVYKLNGLSNCKLSLRADV